MAKLLAFFVIALVALIVNVHAQQSFNSIKHVQGLAFDEIVVSSDLNVRRKSKENRQAKKVLTNVPSGTTGPPGKSTEVAALKLLLSDGSRITPEKRQRREISKRRSLRLGCKIYCG